MPKSPKPEPEDIKPGDAKRGDEVLARMLRTKPQPKWKPTVKPKRGANAAGTEK